MEKERHHYDVVLLCECMQVSRSGYYAWKNRPVEPECNDTFIKERMNAIFLLSRCCYGFRRMQKALKNEGIDCNHKKVSRLMKELKLFPKVKRKFKATTNSNHKLPIEPNRLERKFFAIKPNIAWVGDITYIWTEQGWLYLATVIDLCSRKVKGWAMGERITADLAVSALEMALKQVDCSKALLFHSDRGVQYASHAFKEVIKNNGMVHSMSRKADCWDNAVAESFFGTLKQELVYHCKFKTRDEAKLAIFDYIEVFYNRIRLHSTLDYQTPDSVERAVLAA
ncbi:IS3 family transposase [Candidatus Berkiella cookevillensis]|uniref:IS3 family transposase n=1 Tax=Candidatus Berkiella cookevillensis TaxID=437022 RepID=UPI00217DC8C2|nr:IS3 family transposase [Candidatus Berkiella cookevillensis]